MRADITRILDGQNVAVVATPTTHLPVLSPAAATALIAPTVTGQVLPAEADDGFRYAEPPRRFVGLWAFLVALALVTAGVGAYFIFFNKSNEVEQVNVPQVLHQLQADAERMLVDKKLTFRVSTVDGPEDDTIGKVVRQDPVAGVLTEVGSEVLIEVNVGPNKGTIPDNLVGRNYEDVAKELEQELGFSEVTSEEDSTEPLSAKSGEVTRIDPAGGAKIPFDQPIVVYYATGKSPVPNLKGATEEEAINTAKNSGFTKKIQFSYRESTAEPDTVIEVTPGVGQMVKRTTTLKCVLAKPIETPPPSSEPPPDPDNSGTPDPDDQGGNDQGGNEPGQ
jgi:serine/threonine-protein kinase